MASSELGLTLSVGYHAPFRDVIMQLDYAITGRRYDKSTKLWLVKATEYPQVRAPTFHTPDAVCDSCWALPVHALLLAVRCM